MKKQGLTKIQREILVGILLGDAHLEKPSRLKVEQGNCHKAYIQHLFEVFASFVKDPGPTGPSGRACEPNGLRKPLLLVEWASPREVRLKEKVHINWCFQTIHHKSLLFYRKQFYNPQKRVPAIIHRLLTSRGLAYWFMDDGSIKSKQSKGVIFNTQGFSYAEVCTLCEVLSNKFQLNCWPRRQKGTKGPTYQIYVSGTSYERLRELIYPYLIPEMLYKFPLPRKRGLRLTQLPKE